MASADLVSRQLERPHGYVAIRCGLSYRCHPHRVGWAPWSQECTNIDHTWVFNIWFLGPAGNRRVLRFEWLRRPQTPFKKVGGYAPTFWSGFWGRRGRPNFPNRRFPAGPKFMYEKTKRNPIRNRASCCGPRGHGLGPRGANRVSFVGFRGHGHGPGERIDRHVWVSGSRPSGSRCRVMLDVSGPELWPSGRSK